MKTSRPPQIWKALQRTVLAMAGAACLASAGCGVLAASRPVDPAKVAADPSAVAIAQANNDFGFRMLQTLDEKPSGQNVFFSPLSISSALLMTMSGAGGQTYQEMAQTLAVQTLSLDQVNGGESLLLPYLRNPDSKVKLSIANALWIKNGLSFAPSFQARCQRFYGAKTASVDLSSQTGIDTINDWVSQNTQGKISKIVDGPDPYLVAVLTDAIYFHGQWAKAFKKDDTHTDVFVRDDGAKEQVNMMSQESEFPYLQTDQFQAIALPYGSGRVSFYVFLPSSSVTVDQLAGMLKSDDWDKWVSQLKPTYLEIDLPRFKASYGEDLKSPLSQMGMKSAFDPQHADFGPMGLGNQVCISAVIHKAVIDVDEEGTTAAAATGAEMVASAVREPAITMRVDHPFFCAIRDNETGAILFEGIIRNPQATSGS